MISNQQASFFLFDHWSLFWSFEFVFSCHLSHLTLESWIIVNCHATVLFLAGTQDDYAEDFDPRFCIQILTKRKLFLNSVYCRDYLILAGGIWLYYFQFSASFVSTLHLTLHQTTGPVGDNNTREDNAEAAVVGIILLPFCFDIWIITGSPQE